LAGVIIIIIIIIILLFCYSIGGETYINQMNLMICNCGLAAAVNNGEICYRDMSSRCDEVMKQKDYH